MTLRVRGVFEFLFYPSQGVLTLRQALAMPFSLRFLYFGLLFVKCFNLLGHPLLSRLQRRLKPVPFGQPVRRGQWGLVPVVSHSPLVGCVGPRHRSPRTSDATSATAPYHLNSADSARGRVPCSDGSAAGMSSGR